MAHLAAGAFVVLLSSEAHAQRAPATAETQSSAEEHRALMISAQVLRKEGRLLRALDLLERCDASACTSGPDATECNGIRGYCHTKREELDAEIPSAVVTVRDDRGTILRGASGRVGLHVFESGSETRLDPGTHTVRVDMAGRTVSADFELARGEKAKPVALAIDLRRPVPSRPIPWYVPVLGGASLAAFATGGVLAFAASERRADLESCRPTCDPDLRGPLDRETYGADVAFGIGAVAALAAVFTYLARPTRTTFERQEYLAPRTP